MKRPLLYLLAGSVGLAVVLGIAIVLRNTWGWFEIRVILTTLTIAAASICGLACDISRAARLQHHAADRTRADDGCGGADAVGRVD